MARSEGHVQRNNALRAGFLKPLEFAASAPPTSQTVTEVCKQIGIEHSVEDIPNSTRQARLHWLGKRSAQKTLLYFHGGGFCIPILEGHVKFLGKTIEKVKANGGDLNVAILEYAMSPAARYPIQITQAAEALHFLLAQGHDPSNIIIGGDSAGGNMTLALGSIINHGLDGTQPLKLANKLAGALLICAWVSYDTSSETMKTNVEDDIVSPTVVKIITPEYVTDSQKNEFSEPIRANAAWWKDFPAKKILNIYGGYEVFKDDIVKLGRTLQDAGNAVETVESAKHVHIDPILDEQAGFEEGDMAETIWKWLSSLF